MATETTFLGLVLPGLGEYTDSWNEPLNANFETIDTWADGIGTEIVDARGSAVSLKAFLDVAHNNDGSVKTIPDIELAQNSPVYGDRDPSTLDEYTLSTRINLGDLEILAAREGSETLRESIAASQALLPSMIVSGSKNANNEPTWLSAAADKATINGATTPIWLMIGGRKCRIRTNKEVTISGAAGWYFLYAEYQANGVQVVDGDSRTPPPATATGSTALDPADNTKRRFNDPVHYFSGLLKDVDVQVGDLLTIFNPTVGTVADAGNYYIKALGTGDESTFEIVGKFPGTAGMSGLNYEIRDPLAVTVGVTSTKTETLGRLYIGEVYFDGTAIVQSTSYPLRPYHFKDTYVGDWRYFDLSTSPYNQTEIWEHRLGTDILDFSVQVSQANDGTQPIEELSVANVKNTLAAAVTQPTINVTDGKTLTPNTPQVLGGTITATATGAAVSLTGSVVPSRSVAVQWTRNQIYVKNAVQQLLYTDYATGAERQTGYVRVVVRKRG